MLQTNTHKHSTFSEECTADLKALARSTQKSVKCIHELWEEREPEMIRRTINEYMQGREKTEKRENQGSEENYLGSMGIEGYIKYVGRASEP